MGISNLSDAIQDKVQTEASKIIREAEGRAQTRVQKAKEQRQARYEAEATRLVTEASAEASRIRAQASIKASQEMLAARIELVDDIIKKVKEKIAGLPGDEKTLAGLVREGVDILGIASAKVYVANKDVAAMKRLLQNDPDLAGLVTEVNGIDCLGGVIVEDVEGKDRVDNTFDSRLEMLLPSLLPQIGKELL
jgi:V/A-type H+-transporting ATPase subunit E